MNVREKLAELLSQEDDVCEPSECKYCGVKGSCGYYHTADNLIANGITVQECGHWVSYQSDRSYGCMDDKEWYKCSKCGKDAHGRVDDDEWYSTPILSAYCPHCGVKMISSR